MTLETTQDAVLVDVDTFRGGHAVLLTLKLHGGPEWSVDLHPDEAEQLAEALQGAATASTREPTPC